MEDNKLLKDEQLKQVAGGSKCKVEMDEDDEESRRQLYNVEYCTVCGAVAQQEPVDVMMCSTGRCHHCGGRLRIREEWR